MATAPQIKKPLTKLIAPSFYSVHNDIKKELHTEYWLSGGRGSTKSSFISIEMILGIMNDPQANGLAIRKVKDTTKESVYEQLVWAINELGVQDYWKLKTSPEMLIYKPTGQKILFRGFDKPKKVKSTKVSKGYLKYIWYEELAEFDGMAGIRTANQSFLRGGRHFVVFYSYNPPESKNNWVNLEKTIPKKNRLVHHSTYLTVPREWLGETFFVEAEHLKKTNLEAYNHEYMGEIVGTGGEVFRNLTIREITNEEISQFWNINRGIDYGYATDPFHYTVNHYDNKKKRLYIFYEIHKVNLSNKKAYTLITQENTRNELINAESAEPKSNDEMRGYGLKINAVKKGPDSVEYGIKWLQDLEEIIIDPIRCPNTNREFTSYELEKDAHGNFKAKFPDKDNHAIDSTRYALNDIIMNRTITAGTRIGRF